MSEGGPIRSVLYDVQAEQGAEFEDFDGWLWTSHLGDVRGEYEAIRTGAGLWDVYPLVKWDFRGADAARAVQRIFTNDVAGLEVGQVRYGAFVNEAGAMLDDGTVYRLSDDHLWVMTNNPGYEGWFAEVFTGLDVTVEDRTHEMPLVSLQGPTSRDLLGKLTSADLTGLRYFRFLPEQVEVAGIPVWLSRTGFSGELGFEMIPARDDAVDLWHALVETGARPFGTDAVEIARIEAGLVVVAVDYEPGVTSPYDLSFDRLIRLDVDCLGVARLREIAADPPNRFVTLEIGSDEAPEYGAVVTKEGEVVGTLTSPTVSPRLGTIGLAILRSDAAIEENTVDVAVAEGTVPATVKALSILDPARKRPRS